MAKSERAQRGGGREVALNPGSFQAPYQVGVTYGNTGEGANWFGPGQPMAPQAPEEVAGRAFDFLLIQGEFGVVHGFDVWEGAFVFCVFHRGI